MPRLSSVLVACASTIYALTVTGSVTLSAQSRPATQVSTQASVHSGRIKGVVKDDIGQTVGGVSVIAMGTILAAAKSDERGSFSLDLPPGEYVLRAACDGYVSTYREPVRVQTSALLEKTITLTRQGVATKPVLLASAGGATQVTPTKPEGDDGTSDHSHSDAAWRLRHLPRSILRDTNASDAFGTDDGSQNSFAPHGAFFDRAVEGSARLAASIFGDTDFKGQVNFLTTSVLNSATGWVPEEFPRGIAYVAVGAPAGSHGDWRMRGAIVAGDMSSWVLLGEYQARDEATHAFRVGVSYSAQGYDPRNSSRWAAATTDARNAAGVYGFDRWQIRPSFTLGYGMRVDRYDYVASPELLSPQIGARFAVLPRTFVRMHVSRWMIAPGADEFLPPMSSGLWVPPERTFSSFVPGAEIRAEEVRDYEIGLEHALGGSTPRTILVRRFHQSSSNQVATLFGLDAAKDVGHYYVATPGSVALDGWGVRFSTKIARRLDGAVDYTMASADWDRGRLTGPLRRAVPSVIRPEHEQLHDVAASLNADIPESNTHVTMSYRVNNAYSHAEGGRLPIPAGRFEIELHQGLPYQPVRGSHLEVLFAIRNLLRDLSERGSIYDELLTVSPPLRVLGGVQIKF